MKVSVKSRPTLTTRPKLITGHLYLNIPDDELYLYCGYSDKLVQVQHGGVYSEKGYGVLLDEQWEDVTDKYHITECF